MKKYFSILGFCLFSFFLFVSGMLKVEAKIADDNIHNKFIYDLDFKDYNGINYQSQINRIIDLLNSIDGYYYAITTSYSKYKNEIYSGWIEIYLFENKNVHLKTYQNRLIYDSDVVYRLKVNNEAWRFPGYVGNKNYDLDDLEEALINNNYSIETLTEQFRYTYNVYQQAAPNPDFFSLNDMIYATNLEFKNPYDYSLYFNDVEVKPNEKMIVPHDFSTPPVYTENYRLNSKDIDRIEYTFDFSNALNENNMFFHEFNFSATWISSIARSKLFGAPYLEYKKNGSSYKLPLDEVCIATLDEYSYCDTQINSFMDIQDLKFVVDFNNINNLNGSSEVFIHFDSSLNFTRNVIYIDDENSNFSNYVEVDFTNKYGVLLIPKLLYGSVNHEVYSDLYYLGKGLKINLYDSIDTTKEPVHSENGVYSVGNMWGKFEYLFKFNNYNQYLFFMNSNYLVDDDIKKVRYDKRYFVHSICSSSDNCDKVVNPNTGEEIEIKPPDIGNDSTSDNSLFSMFHFFEEPIKFIFNGIGVLYNDYALPIVQKYWYFGFGFTIFIIILKLFF